MNTHSQNIAFSCILTKITFSWANMAISLHSKQLDLPREISCLVLVLVVVYIQLKAHTTTTTQTLSSTVCEKLPRACGENFIHAFLIKHAYCAMSWSPLSLAPTIPIVTVSLVVSRMREYWPQGTL